MRSNTRIRAGSPTSQGCAPTIARSSHRHSLARERADLFPMLDTGHKSEIRGEAFAGRASDDRLIRREARRQEACVDTDTDEISVMTSGAFTAAHFELIPELERLTKK